jgi:hypothetical protein
LLRQKATDARVSHKETWNGTRSDKKWQIPSSANTRHNASTPNFWTDFPLHPSCLTILLPLKVFWQICFGVRLFTFPIALLRGCLFKNKHSELICIWTSDCRMEPHQSRWCSRSRAICKARARANSLRSRCLLYFRTPLLRASSEIKEVSATAASQETIRWRDQ